LKRFSDELQSDLEGPRKKLQRNLEGHQTSYNGAMKVIKPATEEPWRPSEQILRNFGVYQTSFIVTLKVISPDIEGSVLKSRWVLLCDQ
jgi:hypothetical protein